MKDTYVQSEAQHFTENIVFQPDGALSQITCSARSFWIKCFRIHGLENMVQQLASKFPDFLLT